MLTGFTYSPEIKQTISSTIPAINICIPTLNKRGTEVFCFVAYTVPNDHAITDKNASVTPNTKELFDSHSMWAVYNLSTEKNQPSKYLQEIVLCRIEIFRAHTSRQFVKRDKWCPRRSLQLPAQCIRFLHLSS